MKERTRWGPSGGNKNWRCSAAFFCLLFFAAAKKSRCRPAQGQRVKQARQIAHASDKHKRTTPASQDKPEQRARTTKTSHGCQQQQKQTKPSAAGTLTLAH